MRICYVADLLSPRPIEFTNSLASTSGVEFRAVYFRVADELRHRIHYSHADLRAPQLWKARAYVCKSVIHEVERFRPDLVVVEGYSVPSVQLLTLWLTMKGWPWVPWAERPGMRKGPLPTLVRRVLLCQTAHHSSGVFAIGLLAQRVYAELVRDRAPVCNVPYFIDLARYMGIPRSQDHQRTGVRFLYVGQLIHRKGVDTLLDAFRHVVRQGPEVYLTIVGDGPEKDHLMGLLDRSVQSRVEFLGFSEWSALPRHYEACDVLCFPSRHDGWGLPLYEAMASAMPVIATSTVGAAHDLITNGVTGYIVPPNGVAQLAEAMLRFVDDPRSAIAMGHVARATMHDYTLEAGVRRFLGAAQRVLHSHA